LPLVSAAAPGSSSQDAGAGIFVGDVFIEELGPAAAGATARRIVAAYNASAGVPVAQLEANIVGQLFEAARALLAEPCDATRRTLALRGELAGVLRRMEPREGGQDIREGGQETREGGQEPAT